MTRQQGDIMCHSEIQMYLYLIYRQHTEVIEMEKRLPNNKKADIYYEYNNDRYIIEVKTELKQSLLEDALEKYSNHCDFLVMAAPPDQYRHQRRDQVLNWTRHRHEKVGKLAVQWGRIDVIRHPTRL